MVSPAIRERMSTKDLYETLYMRILTGKLRPGAVISETRIAEEVGMSRTPVRQAFQRLADTGFLIVVPQVGTYVAPIEISAVKDAQFVREMLECNAVAQAAASQASDKQARLYHYLNEQRELLDKGDHIGFFLSDEAMHRTLMEIAGHPHVWGMIGSAKVSMDRLRYLSLEKEEWLTMIFKQHEDLLNCVVAGDMQGSVSLMQAHLRTAFAAIQRIAAENADFFADHGTKPRE